LTIIEATFKVTDAAIIHYHKRCFDDKTDEERKTNSELLEAIQLVNATARVFSEMLRKFYIIK
jgi:hypothetical protein